MWPPSPLDSFSLKHGHHQVPSWITPLNPLALPNVIQYLAVGADSYSSLVMAIQVDLNVLNLPWAK
jgi:hypothetical protein